MLAAHRARVPPNGFFFSGESKAKLKKEDMLRCFLHIRSLLTWSWAYVDVSAIEGFAGMRRKLALLPRESAAGAAQELQQPDKC